MSPDSSLVRAVSPSPNFGTRHGRAVDALILHYTGMATGAAARARLLDPSSQVSCHYLVWEDGRIEQLVAEADRAWHAGRSCWAGERDMNSVSIGIEIVNGGHEGGCPPYPAPQIEAVVGLARDICGRRRIAGARVLGHSDIAPDRKRDPGEWFPWRRLVEAGIVRVPVPECRRPDVALSSDVPSALRAIGYDIPDIGTPDTEAHVRAVICAFQRHHRPARVDGVADVETCAAIAALRTEEGGNGAN